jgi:GTP-binding protein EngB required for normal cell division
MCPQGLAEQRYRCGIGQLGGASLNGATGGQAEEPDRPARGSDGVDRLSSLLAAAAAKFDALWSARSAHSSQLRELGGRLVEQRLQIAVLGQFKRGKSTLLNALLGQPLLPTGVVPLTAIPTFLHWGAAPSLRVAYLDDRPADEKELHEPAEISAELFRLVTEEGNPRNREKVARVDLALPAALLAHGIVLIDTPGIGSTYQHNTDAALAVLPECDAALFVLSVDPPVTAAELDYLDRINPHAARLFFILNKIDHVAEPERAAAMNFLRRTLCGHMPAGSNIEIFGISARDALDAKQKGEPDRLTASGLAEVETYLADFLAREKNAALRQAIVSKARRVFDAASMDIALAIRAIEMPIADLQSRAAHFGEAIREVERQRRAAEDLLAGDRRRALDELEKRAAALRREARSALLAVGEAALVRDGAPDAAEAAARAVIAEAIPDFFGPKLEELSRSFSREAEELLAGHIEAAEILVGSVRQQAAELFDIPTIPRGGADAFQMKREPFWVTQKWDQTIGSLAAGALEKLLPAALRLRRSRKRLTEEIEELVQRNVENLRWAMLQNLENAFRQFTGWLDERLAEAIAATQGAIKAALNRRLQHEDRAEEELSRLRAAAEWIAVVQRELE